MTLMLQTLLLMLHKLLLTAAATSTLFSQM